MFTINEKECSESKDSFVGIAKLREKRLPKYHLPVRVKNLFYDEHFFEGNQSNEPKNMMLIHENPNIYLINNFLSSNELNNIDSLITDNMTSFQKSFTEDDDNDRIYSAERTNKFFFLPKGKGTLVRQIENRAADLIGFPVRYIEPLQIVHYTAGQQFTTHHDAGTLLEDGKTVELIKPKRLLTFFVYLNDLPFGNGFTEFPLLSLSVLPKRGQALLFCNILPDGNADERVVHKAMPVHSPLQKFGMNIWISEKEMPAEVNELHCYPSLSSFSSLNKRRLSKERASPSLEVEKRKTAKRKKKLESEHEIDGEDDIERGNSRSSSSLRGNGSLMKLQYAEQLTQEYYANTFPVEKEDLYFHEEPDETKELSPSSISSLLPPSPSLMETDGFSKEGNTISSFSSQSSSVSLSFPLSVASTLSDVFVPLGKNYFFGLSSIFKDSFEIHDQKLVERILEFSRLGMKVDSSSIFKDLTNDLSSSISIVEGNEAPKKITLYFEEESDLENLVAE
jgi:prolyl 4-hydroxylase